ncbi:hypothetical protein DFH11DRAFT_1746464 [Phellopilus nigrolimitatus]|nr:hypothetical protein DFH11DRAFT_1746464 [Phellopilus nigrolimitatus]
MKNQWVTIRFRDGNKIAKRQRKDIQTQIASAFETSPIRAWYSFSFPTSALADMRLSTVVWSNLIQRWLKFPPSFELSQSTSHQPLSGSVNSSDLPNILGIVGLIPAYGCGLIRELELIVLREVLVDFLRVIANRPITGLLVLPALYPEREMSNESESELRYLPGATTQVIQNTTFILNPLTYSPNLLLPDFRRKKPRVAGASTATRAPAIPAPAMTSPTAIIPAAAANSAATSAAPVWSDEAPTIDEGRKRGL